MVDVNSLFFNHSTCDDNSADEHDIEQIVKGIDDFARLTSSSCFIIDFDKHEIIYRSGRLLYVDEASGKDVQRRCENPYWALVPEETLAKLVEMRKQYPVGGHLISMNEYSTHICIIDYPIMLHGEEFYVNQRFTPLVMRNDGITKIGLFLMGPSSSKSMEGCIITESGQRFRYDFEKGQFHEFDLKTTLSIVDKVILQRVQKGMKIEEIADNLNMSVSTVKTHRMRIFKKLGVKSIFEALTIVGNYHLI